MVDIQYATAGNWRGEKKKKKIEEKNIMAYPIPYGGHKNNGKRKLATKRQSKRRQFRTQMLSRYADAPWQSYCGSVMLF